MKSIQFGQSNFVKIKDLEEFYKICEEYHIKVKTLKDCKFRYRIQVKGKHAFEWFDTNPTALELISNTLADNEVLIFYFVSIDHVGDIMANIQALNNKGESIESDFWDICKEAEKLGDLSHSEYPHINNWIIE